MQRKLVDSSRVKSIGYDHHSKILEIEFHRGGIYQYSPITEEAYLQLVKAESKGVWVNKNLIGNKNITCTKQ